MRRLYLSALLGIGSLALLCSVPEENYSQSFYGRDSLSKAPVAIAVYDNYFLPRTVTIRPGVMVEWTNYGHHKHTATSDDKVWDTGDMPRYVSYSWSFPVEGIYHYHCKHHEGMAGTIVVKDSPSRKRGGGSGGY
ncbi:MAG: hypothetical protein ACJ8FY_12950 [Gemmataceae bacterium]